MNTETEKLRQRWPFGLFLAGGTKEPPALFRVTAQSVCRRGRYCAGGGSLSRKARERETDEIGGISKKKRTKKKSSIIISIPKSSDMVIYADGFGSVCVRAYVVLLCQQKRIRDI